MRGARSIAVTGAGGLIGSTLAASMVRKGYRVIRGVRDRSRAGPNEFYWNGSTGEIEAEKLADVDAVVHLAGRNLTTARWTEAEKTHLSDSRVRGTRLMARTLAALRPRAPALVAASAIGYYGDRGAEELDETSPPGEGFLAGLCRAWEAACEPAERAGVRVVRLRIGIVLSAAGGALPRMVLPFRFGLGGKLAHGRQFMSWISLHDLIRIVGYVVSKEEIDGALNAVAPVPLTNAEFTRILARVLRRPAPLSVPALAIRMLWGEMGKETLLASARVVPRRLDRLGFEFDHSTLEQALRAELNRLG